MLQYVLCIGIPPAFCVGMGFEIISSFFFTTTAISICPIDPVPGVLATIQESIEQLLLTLVHFNTTWHVSNVRKVTEVLYISLIYSVVSSDYPWRSAAQPLTSNVIKWWYLPDFAMRPNPSFIFCEFLFVLFEPVPPRVTL